MEEQRITDFCIFTASSVRSLVPFQETKGWNHGQQLLEWNPVWDKQKGPEYMN